MRSPGSGQEMIIVEVNGVELDVCPAGTGVWFDADELRQLFLIVGAPEELLELDQRLERLPKRNGPMRRCPRCGARMWHVATPGRDGRVVLDACPHDHGLWFDPGELEAIMQVHLADEDESLIRVREHLGAFLTSAEGEPAES